LRERAKIPTSARWSPPRKCGYQGNDFSKPEKMASTVKHLAAYGAAEAGREYNTVDMSVQRLFNDYLPPYTAAIDAGAATVMSAFNSLNGVPASADPYLLQSIHPTPERLSHPGGLVTVTADRPVNRADLAAAIVMSGYTVLA